MKTVLRSLTIFCVVATSGASAADQRLVVPHPGIGIDATVVIQAALDGSASEIVLDAGHGEWLTGPLFVRRNDVRISLLPGTILRGKSGAFPGKEDALLTVQKQSGFTLIAHGAELVMPGEDFTEGEHRHCLNLRSVDRVRIHGGTYARSGGDGIYLGTRDGRRTNHDIVITDVVSRENRRQGMSVTCASHLLLRDCLFLDTGGTAPEAGLDFEPNHEDDFFIACLVSHCLAINNAAQGFENHFNRLRATSKPIEITYDHCYAEGAAKYGFTVLASDAKYPSPPGLLTLEHCVARRNGTAGIRTRNGATGGLRALVTDSYILHPGATDKRAPLWFLAQEGTAAPHGDAEFRRLRIVDTQARPPVAASLQGSAARHGLGAFTGDAELLSPATTPLRESARALLPDLTLTHHPVELGSLELHHPAAGRQWTRGEALTAEVASRLPDASRGWKLRCEVWHDARLVHSEEQTLPHDPLKWTPSADLSAGLYSLWFTLTDAQNRVHDIATTAITLR